MKKNDENGKDDNWKVPMKLHGAGKGAYDVSMGAAGGTSPDMQERSNEGKLLSAKGKKDS